MFRRTPLFLLSVGLLATFVFLFRLGQANIVTSHEARVTATAATMARSGLPWAAQPVTIKAGVEGAEAPKTREVNPWLIPVFENAARLHKPPLPYWTTAALYVTCGASELTSRILPALMGILATFLLYGLTKDVAGRNTARWTAIAWVSTLFVVGEYRKAMADPYLAFFSLAAVWAWVRMSRDASARRGGRAGGVFGLAMVFYLSIALGLLAKGPVILLHTLIPMLLFGLLYRQRPRLGWTLHIMGTLLVLLVTLPWPIYVVARVPGAVELWRFESVGEFTDNTINARPWYFYLPALFQLAMPWTPVWIAGLVLVFQRKRRALLFPVLWYAAIVLVFSFVNLKKNAYLLPAMPAQAMIVGYVLALIGAWARRKVAGTWPKLLLDGQMIMGIIMGAVVAVMAIVGPVARGAHQPVMKVIQETMLRAGGRSISLSGIVALVALAAGLLPLLRGIRGGVARRAIAQAAVYAVLIALSLGFIEAEKQNQRSRQVDFANPSAEPASPPRK